MNFTTIMAKSEKNICIIGIGMFGSAIIDQLLKMSYGTNIAIIDSDEKVLLPYKDTIENVYVADAASIRALKEIDVNNFDIVIVAVSANIEIIACLLELNVRNIIARASGSRHARVLKQIGIRMIVSPEEYSGIRTALIATNEKFLAYHEDLTELGGDYVVGTAEVLNPHTFLKISELELENVNVVFVMRKNEFFVAKGDFVLRKGDVVKIFGNLDDVINKINYFSSKQLLTSETVVASSGSALRN